MKSFALISPEDSAVIRMAWEDRTTFDEIKTRTGLSEAQVIALMRRSLSASSFRMWRKRVHGRVTKHRQRLQQRLNPVDEGFDDAIDGGLE
jgi:uncharacterized protein (TIGR03643 family)